MTDDTMIDDTIRQIRRRFRRLSSILISSVIVSSLIVPPAFADSLIRDAEIEHTLRAFGDPIFKVADLDPKAVQMFIVDENIINSYVAGGQNIFVYTGLILACENPTMLLGVLAHETGHIADGHLARGSEDLKNAPLGQIFGYVLGAAAAAAGSGAAGMAIMSGSDNIIGRKILGYTRAHEEAADQAALRFLDALHISASGMIEVFDVLRRDEMRQFGTPDPYLQTHPLSNARINYIREHTNVSSIPYGAHPAALDVPLARTRAKLYAFLNIPPKTLARYPVSDHSVAARMARAVAWFKQPDFERANTEMKSLIKDYPKDPYLYDLYGQILFESQHTAEALTAYQKAATLAPDSALILTALGQAQLTQDQAKQAAATLEQASSLDNTNPQTWHLLGTAYDKLGDSGRASLALAEEALLEDQPKLALQQANNALKSLKAGTPAALHAEDVKRAAEEMKRREREDKNGLTLQGETHATH